MIFELSVALAYAAAGWEVEFIKEGAEKSPDMRVVRQHQEFFIECKRMARRTQYAEIERNEFCAYGITPSPYCCRTGSGFGSKEVSMSMHPRCRPIFFYKIWKTVLPVGAGEKLIHHSLQATVHARLIDRVAVHRHMHDFWVKANSPMLHSRAGR